LLSCERVDKYRRYKKNLQLTIIRIERRDYPFKLWQNSG